VARANTLADLRGWSPFAGIQVEYSLIERAVERELVPMAHSLDLAVLGWAPLGRGLLTGKYTKDGPSGGEQARLAADDPRLNDRNLAIVEATKEVAGDLGTRPAAVAIAWLLARSGPVVIPIVGARTAEQLRRTLGGVELELPGEALSRLSEVSGIQLGFPHDFLAGLYARHAVSGAIKTVPSTRGREIGTSTEWGGA
jgi:aryl-alcohol dehydrogenase-like predicted oxidoreductase